MKKKILIGIVAIIACLYLVYISGWKTFILNKDTPDEFLSRVTATREKYAEDVAAILKQLNNTLTRHDEPFHSKIYDGSTKLSIDTILYSPDLKRLSVFIIARIPESAKEVPDERYDWHYDGFCCLGGRLKDSIDMLSIDNGFGSHSIDKVRESLRTRYFRLFATDKDVNGQYKNKYNMNDIRFWTGPAWQNFDEIKEEDRKFEIEKREHPENVYEPK